jgi:hypothetical protein
MGSTTANSDIVWTLPLSDLKYVYRVVLYGLSTTTRRSLCISQGNGDTIPSSRAMWSSVSAFMGFVISGICSPPLVPKRVALFHSCSAEAFCMDNGKYLSTGVFHERKNSSGSCVPTNSRARGVSALPVAALRVDLGHDCRLLRRTAPGSQFLPSLLSL